MKKASLLLLIAFNAKDMRAADIEAFLGFSPNSPQVFGNAKVQDLALVGGDISFGRTVEYVASFEYLKVPGSGIDNYAMTPIGLRVNITNKKIHPFLVTDEGVIASTRPIPYPNDVGLNFIVDFGAGLQIGRMKFGYKFTHISNAETYRKNPGLDANVLFVSFTLHRGKA